MTDQMEEPGTLGGRNLPMCPLCGTSTEGGSRSIAGGRCGGGRRRLL
jgi:hypothetical protein